VRELAATVEVRVKPRSKHDRITLSADRKIDVAVTSPPVDGKANEHVIRLLAKQVGVPKSAISIVKGELSKIKVFRIEGYHTIQAVFDALRHSMKV
jgi:hypothetical protein